MKQLTIRGLEPELEERVRKLARSEGISLNQAVLRLLRRGAGMAPGAQSQEVVGSSLDHLIGTWTEAEEQELLDSIRDVERVDDEIWR